MIPLERLDALDAAIERGEVLRGEWTCEEDGRQLACLLAHVSPEVATAKSVSACPAKTLDPWFAHLLLYIDDECSLERRDEFLRRTAAVLRQWHRLSTETRRRLDYECRAVAVREVRPHVPLSEAQMIVAIDSALLLIARACAGEVLSEQEGEAVRCSLFAVDEAMQLAATAAVRSVAASALPWAERAVWSSSSTVDPAAAANAARAATRAVVAFAFDVLEPAGSAAAVAAWTASAEASADRMINQMLSAMERECAKVAA